MDDLIERARKMVETKRYSILTDMEPAAALIDPEELVAMKAVIRDLADALEGRLPKENGDG